MQAACIVYQQQFVCIGMRALLVISAVESVCTTRSGSVRGHVAACRSNFYFPRAFFSLFASFSYGCVWVGASMRGEGLHVSMINQSSVQMNDHTDVRLHFLILVQEISLLNKIRNVFFEFHCGLYANTVHSACAPVTHHSLFVTIIRVYTLAISLQWLE